MLTNTLVDASRPQCTRRQFVQAGLATASTALLPTLGFSADQCQQTKPAWTLAKLQAHVQSAVELELFTIPPYLTALYSIKDPSSTAYALIRSVVVEEMLHLQLACNLLTAIGGRPRLTGDAAPKYPNPIPNIAPTYYIKLAPASIAQVETFVAIETPTYTLPKTLPHPGPDASYATIGELYDSVINGIRCLGEDIFTGAPTVQVSSYGSNDVIITDTASAVKAINVITDQGEGGKRPPHKDLDGIKGHFERFEDIVKEGPTQFSGDQVYPMVDNPGEQNLPEKLNALARFSDDAYAWLLQALERGFNGDPRGVGQTVGGLMYQVTQPLSVYLMGQRINSKSRATLGPRFQYHAEVTHRGLQASWQQLDMVYRQDKTLQNVARVLGLRVS